jgi:hypothetical protein
VRARGRQGRGSGRATDVRALRDAGDGQTSPSEGRCGLGKRSACRTGPADTVAGEHAAVSASACPARTDEQIAATDISDDDLIAIEPADWPKLRVLLEVFFGVGERDALPEARTHVEAAEFALEELEEKWGKKYLAVIRLWCSAWTEFIPVLDYDTGVLVRPGVPHHAEARSGAAAARKDVAA